MLNLVDSYHSAPDHCRSCQNEIGSHPRQPGFAALVSGGLCETEHVRGKSCLVKWGIRIFKEGVDGTIKVVIMCL